MAFELPSSLGAEFQSHAGSIEADHEVDGVLDVYEVSIPRWFD